MDFDLSEEQRLLKESVDGLLGSSYDFDARKKYMAQKGGWSKAVWGKFAEQGLLGLPFSEDEGGFGAGAIETMIVMEALGKALVLEPYLPTVVIGGGFLRRSGSAAQKAASAMPMASACFWCPATPRASRRRAIRPRTACTPPISASRVLRSVPMP